MHHVDGTVQERIGFTKMFKDDTGSKI